MVLRADPASLSLVRERVRRWLDALRWPLDEVDDIVMAANEAVSSAIEHAVASGVRSEVHVAGRPFVDGGGRRVAVGVAGDGGWEPGPGVGGGYGVMVLLHTCMDSVEIGREGGRTTVLMTSVPVPPIGRQ